MLDIIWLPLMSLIGFENFGMSSSLRAYIITFLLVIDYILVLSHSKQVKLKDFSYFGLLILAVPYRNLVLVFDILVASKLLLRLPFDRILFIKFFGEIASILLLFFLLYSGSLIDTLQKYNKTQTYLHTFGFANSNIPALFFFNFMVTLYLLWKRFNAIPFILIALGINQIIYHYCHSRTIYLAFLILAFLGFICEKKYIEKRIANISSLTVLFLFLLTLSFPLFILSHKNYSYLDKLISGRGYYISKALLHMKGLKWIFGTYYRNKGPMDNAYIYSLLTGGIFFCLYFINIFHKAMLSKVNLIKKTDIPIMISFAIAGFTENFIIGTPLTSLIFWLILKKRVSNNIECKPRQISAIA